MIKKADILLACFMIVIGVSSSIALAGSGESGSYAEITVSGDYYGTYDLYENQEISIRENGHTNILKIENGSISMIESDCHNKQCIKQGAISKSSQTIVCLPNQVLVNINDENREFDAVTY